MRHIPLVLALLALPVVAAACPVCGAATENNRMAYLGMTIFMSLLPLAGIGGVALWVWKRSRDLTDHPPQP
jgi:hypothetical protein